MNLKKIISEEVNDFEWTEEIPSDIHVGKRFTVGIYSSSVYTITEIDEENSTVVVSWVVFDDERDSTVYTMDTVSGFFKNNEWVVYHGVNESTDFEWAEDTPEKKTLRTLEVGDVVHYDGHYDNCHNWPYEITRVFNNGRWFDLSAVTKWTNTQEMVDISQSRGNQLPYNEIDSVPSYEIVII